MKHPDGMIYGLPNCGIVACAIASGLHYNAVWEWFKKRNNRRGNWKGKTWHTDYSAFLDEHGIKHRYYHPERQTLKRFADTLKPSRLYMIRIRGHIVCAQGGITIDQFAAMPISDHFMARRVVKNVWEIMT